MFIKTLDTSDPMQIILKLPGDDCNMNCIYCYEKRRPYDSAGYMRPAVLETFLRSLGRRSLSVQLHGGEPLMIGVEAMEETIAVLRRYGGRVTLNIQTNGVLLDDRWLDLFDRSWGAMEFGISLDGDVEADSYRMDYEARSRHDTVERAIRRCCDRNRTIGIISAVNRRVIGRVPQVLDYFARFPAIKMINFSPCMDFNREGETGGAAGSDRGRTGTLPEWAVTPGEYREFVEEVFEYWRDNELFKRFLIEPIYSIMRAIHRRPARFCHFNNMKCLHIMTLYPDGHVGRCDELGPYDDTVARVRVDAERVEPDPLRGEKHFLEKIEALAGKCAGCAYVDVCRGGCVAARMRYRGTEYDHEYCVHRAALIDFVARGIKAPAISKPVPTPAGTG